MSLGRKEQKFFGNTVFILHDYIKLHWGPNLFEKVLLVYELNGPLEPKRVNAVSRAVCFAVSKDLLIRLKLMDSSYPCLIVQRFACRPTKSVYSSKWLVTALNMGEPTRTASKWNAVSSQQVSFFLFNVGNFDFGIFLHLPSRNFQRMLFWLAY